MRTILSPDPPPSSTPAHLPRTNLARWLSRNAFLGITSIVSTLYSPSVVFHSAILAGLFVTFPERFLFVLLISALTAFLFAARGIPFWLLLASYLAAWPLRRRMLHDAGVAVMLFSGGGLLLWRLVEGTVFQGGRLFVVIAETSLSAMLGYFYMRVTQQLQSSKKPELGRRLSLIALFFYPMLLGIGNLTVFNLMLRPLVIVAAVWLLSYTQDAAWGALAGLLGGLIFWQEPLTSFYWSATLGLLGALIGFTSEFGRFSSLSIYAFGLIAANGYIISQGGHGYIFESVVAFIMLSFAPEQLLQSITGSAKVLAHHLRPGPSVYASEKLTLGRLEELSEMLSEMASFFQPPLVPSQPYSGRASGIALLLQERCCVPCLKASTCLARSTDLFEAVAQSKLSDEEASLQQKLQLQQFTEFCYRPEMLFQEARHLADLYRLNDYWQSNWSECNAMLNHQLFYMAKLLQQVNQGFPQARQTAGQRRFRLECQRLQRAPFAEAICGDSLLCSEIGKYAVLAISDGMGSGASANHESKSAMRLLERLLHLDYPPQQALQTINTMLLARSVGERFATLDVLIIDLCNCEGDIYKSGAAPSFLIRDNVVHEIAGNGLPAGALPDLAVEKRHLTLRNDDIIVMISDGMLSLGDEQEPTAALTKILEEALDDPLQTIAERLMLSVDGEGGNKLPDDRTVLIGKFLSR